MKLVINKSSFKDRSGKHTINLPVAAGVQPDGEKGFSLIETTIAMLLMLIVALGSASLFTFSIYNNSGGSDRALALAIAQQQMEDLRGAIFNATTTDARLNAGTTNLQVISGDNRSFSVTRTIANTSSSLKTITITVRSQAIVTGWASGAGGTITLMSQRTRAD